MQVRDFTQRSGKRRYVLVALLAGTALGGFAAGHDGWAESAPPTTTLQQTASGAIKPTGTTNLLPDFSALVTQVRPAVVSITTKLKPQPDQDQADMPFFPGMRHPGGGEMHAVEARGSGFIIDKDGTIVTNNHVVKGEQSVSVTLDNGTTYPAKIVGTDPKTDLAVLRIDAGHSLPFIELGNSNDVKPGQWVVAMGNPFGLGGSVTAGIVSARGRDIGDGPYDSFIQVDAPINQGNSGGPLFTQDGKVIGVNTAILSPSGGSVGIGFAIPSNTVKAVVQQIEEHGHVTRGYLGVETQGLGGAMTAALHLPSSAGALVASVQPDSPASKAGLQPGDVIETVNGTTVETPRDLAVDIADVKPGTSTQLGILRDGNTQTVDVTVAALPNETAENGQGQAADQNRGIGLALAPITPDVRDQLNLPSQVHGAVIAEVQPGSPAEQAGLQAGDVVVGVANKAISNPSEAASAIRAARAGGNATALRVMRDGNTMFVAIPSAQGNSNG
jgi:serine protease Do